ncbi:MAG: exodeoxyribonuclease VII small subunit [Cytophagales bacterium]|nr:exodeoxyribonuclease VII small subunit [Bernardetiaceae bacterium]MDW8210225.1 exodeoxyribonuclease VII small subunit [Cytophagales bacterium]
MELTSTEKLTYQKALEELQEIYHAIESDQVSMDDLATKVERAYLLLRFCKERLRATEQQLEQLMKENE